MHAYEVSAYGRPGYINGERFQWRNRRNRGLLTLVSSYERYPEAGLYFNNNAHKNKLEKKSYLWPCGTCLPQVPRSRRGRLKI